MSKFNKKKVFLIMMLMSTLMVMSSSKWLSIWMGMEINMMTTIPFLFKNKSKELSQKIMIYFLIQAMGSIIMLTMILIKNFNWNMSLINILMTLSMMIKLGTPPFHPWMPEMFNKMNWDIMFVMITLQKINPLIVTSQLSEQNKILTIIMITSATVGSISGINQLSLNKIMAFSSINHMAWMLMCMLTKNELWMKYFIIYSIITATLCVMFHKNLIFYTNQLNINSNNPSKIKMLLMMLNLGGLPPLPGFFLKWMTVEAMMTSGYFLIMTIMIFSSMVTLMFYMRMMYTSMMLSSMTLKFKLMDSSKYFYSMIMVNIIMPIMILI
uniref:NADH-ubiquinone oxidoreductase chain 2 n=1 Tax=Trachypeplus jacobsoni TaxID=2172479 RepID=A0A343WNR2_9HEMI|nr:NADH dehydrogenase subunit 2 [Trachypeplus jacobsoni]AWD31638.1 NADH dehydrogenase subunit 2 [Trachypeplus jacobsoni]